MILVLILIGWKGKSGKNINLTPKTHQLPLFYNAKNTQVTIILLNTTNSILKIFDIHSHTKLLKFNQLFHYDYDLTEFDLTQFDLVLKI